MKSYLILLFMFLSFSVFADATDPVRPEIEYNCSSDKYLITGSDGTSRSCYPYICSLEDSGKSYSPTCRTQCLDSVQCQAGTVCDPISSQCVTGH